MSNKGWFLPAYFLSVSKMQIKNLMMGVLVCALSACAQTPETDNADNEINSMFHISHPNDPLEPLNRIMWGINYDFLDPYIARPVSLAYVHIFPSFARAGISNFISNLEEPMSMVNSLLILEGQKAVTHFNRFWINSTFGLGGILDVASAADIQKHKDREFGDVLGYYNVGQGPYFMIPVYGPLTLREGVGGMVDGVYPPLSLLTAPQAFLKWIFSGMESRAAVVPQESILEASPDPYVLVRDAYLQNKAFSATGGEKQEEDEFDDESLEEFMDEIDDY